MKTRFAAFILVAGLAMVGVFHGAKAQDSGASQLPCTVLNYSLGIGDYDTQAVTALQEFLLADGYMSHAPTGYFGVLTYKSVVSFQISQGILPTGFVGPLTRAAIQNLSCNNPVPNPTPVPSSTVILGYVDPSMASVGATVHLYGSGFTPDTMVFFGNGLIQNPQIFIPTPCTSIYTCPPTGLRPTITFTIPSYITPYCASGMMCAQYAQLVTSGVYPISIRNGYGTSNTINLTITDSGSTGSPISISGVDAPNSIPIHTPGTWQIHTQSNYSGNLHYSALWGDELVYASGNIMAPTPSTIQSSATFTHTYTRTGIFTPTFTVSDDYGHSATTSVTVTVTPMYYY